jgi:hypothetical protein
MTGADFNADGAFDLVVENWGSGNISVLAGNGNGTFQEPINITVGNTPYFAGVSDFNGDNMPDLAVTNSGSNTVSVLMNNVGPFRCSSDRLTAMNQSYQDIITIERTSAAASLAFAACG